VAVEFYYLFILFIWESEFIDQSTN